MVEHLRWVSTVVAAVTFCAVEVLLLRAALLPRAAEHADTSPGLRYQPSALELLWTALPALVLLLVLAVSIAWGGLV